MATIARTEDQVAGRGAVLGGLIGVFVMTVAVAVLGVSTGTELGGAIGLGMFCAFWGGLGFGSMLGATISLMKAQEQAEAAEEETATFVAPTVEARGPVASPAVIAAGSR